VLIESVLAQIAELPPVAVYVIIALLAAAENVFPPIPTDLVVALGAFLSHRGVTNPALVFLIVWVANVGGAAAVYFAARRYGQRFLTSGAGRWLLSPSALATVEREYLRFGVVGIFFGRLLPGIRAVVAPFVGMVHLSAPRAIVPMALASGLWYGGITIAATTVGAEWGRIARLVGHLNRTLGVVGAIVAALVLVALVVRWRRGRRMRVVAAVERALGPGRMPRRSIDPRDAALLALELAYADPAFTAEDRAGVAAHLCERWGIAPPASARLIADTAELSAYSDRIVSRFERDRRRALVEEMWLAAFAECAAGGAAAEREERLMARAAALLGVAGEDLAGMRRRAETP
jgi:membrane protein DedA with SNARE-associated domain/uncharacterized tellurite resistance protein B-like protein